MRFDCNEFNDVASALLKGNNVTQAHIRTAVGRAYYSQYGSLRAKIEATYPGTFRNQGWHRQLCETCIESARKSIRRVGVLLKHLHELRTDADYAHEKDIDIADAEGAIAAANELKEKIRNLSAEDIDAIYSDLARKIAHTQEKTPRSERREWRD